MQPIYLRQLVFICICLGACSQANGPGQAFADGNYEEALRLWRPLAAQGDLEALNYLGVHYYLGLGTVLNHEQAAHWFEQAAQQGHPDGQRNFGMMYKNGYGVEQNFVNAYMWFYAAFRQGNQIAETYLRALMSEYKLTPNQMNYAKQMAAAYIMTPVRPDSDLGE